MSRLPILWLLVSASCAGLGAQPFWHLGDGLELDRSPEPTGADAVVLHDRCRLWIIGLPQEPATQLDCQRAVQVLQPRGFDAADGRIEVPRGHLVHFAARTLLPDGRSVHVPADGVKELVVERSAGPGGRSRRVWVFAYPAVEVGAILEVRYTLRTDGWWFRYRHRLDDTFPVRFGRFEVWAPEPVSLGCSSEGFFTRPPVEIGGERRLVWQVEALPAHRTEPLGLHRVRSMPTVEVALAKVRLPIGLGGETQELQSTWATALSPLWWSVARAAELPRRSNTEIRSAEDASEVARLWALVQGGIIDRAGVWAPDLDRRTAGDVADSRHGTAEERALVLLSAVANAGYGVALIIVPSAQQPDLAEQPATLSAEEHWLVAVDRTGGEPLLLDPACVGCDPGVLAPEHRGRQGVSIRPVDPSGVARNLEAHLVRLRDETEPEVQLTEELAVERGVLWRRAGWVELRGATAGALRRWRIDGTSGDLESVVRALWIPAGLTGQLEAGQGGALLVRLAPGPRPGLVSADPYRRSSLAELYPLGSLERLAPTRVGSVRLDGAPGFVRRTALKLSSKVELVQAPPSRALSSSAGTYQLKVEVVPAGLELQEELRWRSSEVPTTDYAGFFAFVESLLEARGAAIVLRERFP